MMEADAGRISLRSLGKLGVVRLVVFVALNQTS